jgi:hypothetical protein
VNAQGTKSDGTEKDNVVTVMTSHIENKGTPACRRGQLDEVLQLIGHRNNPVIFAGDFNTFGSDGRPTTVEGMLRARFGNPQWLARQVIKHFVPYSGFFFTAYDTFKWFKSKDDPTSWFSPEHDFFNHVRDLNTFFDGTKFDFRGDDKHSGGRGHTLANSNARDDKGFVTTEAFARPLSLGPLTLIGKYPIDWIFVRSYMRGDDSNYKMAPHFPLTLEAVRDATIPRLADHAPKVVLLPLSNTGCDSGGCTSSDPGDDVPEVPITMEPGTMEMPNPNDSTPM